MPYQPADDEVLAHRFDGDYADVFFSVWTNHGNARPHYYVCLDENGEAGRGGSILSRPSYLADDSSTTERSVAS